MTVETIALDEVDALVADGTLVDETTVLGPPPGPGPPGRLADRRAVTLALPRNAEEYLSWLDVERGRSPRTLASYRRDLASYQAFVARRSSGALIDGATPERRGGLRGLLAPHPQRGHRGPVPLDAAGLPPLPGRGGRGADRPHRGHPRHGGGRPAAQGAQRGRDGPAARARWSAPGRPCCATGPCSSCSTAPGPGSARWSGLNLGDVAEAVDDGGAAPDPGPRQGEQGAGGAAGAPGPGRPWRSGSPARDGPTSSPRSGRFAATPTRSSSTSAGGG